MLHYSLDTNGVYIVTYITLVGLIFLILHILRPFFILDCIDIAQPTLCKAATAMYGINIGKCLFVSGFLSVIALGFIVRVAPHITL